MIDLDTVVVDAHSLPALPQSACRLATMLTSGDYDLAEVADVIRLDPVLTANILLRANSARLGGVEEIVDVRQAVMRMGPAEALGIAVSGPARPSLESSLDAYGITTGQLWRHSVAAALAVEKMSSMRLFRPLPEAFATALLHDLGLALIGRQLRPNLAESIRRSRMEGHRSTVDSELEILGVHHGEAGGLAAANWGLGESIVEGIVHHHSPEGATTERGRMNARTVMLADAVAIQIGASTGDAGALVSQELDSSLCSPAVFRELCSAVAEEFDSVLSRYA